MAKADSAEVVAGIPPEDDENLFKAWKAEIDNALAREKDYRTDGRRIVELFEAQKAKRDPFAILYSNTETLGPAVYNAVPIPVVDRRFKDADPLGKLAAETGTRLLKYLIEAESEDYDSFDELMQTTTLNGLVPNRGMIRWKYVANDDVSKECVYGESVKWDKVFHGYARTWKKIPWLGFEWDMTRAELVANFGPEIGNAVKMSSPDEDDRRSDGKKQELKGVTLAKVYEIWNKADRKVRFISPGYAKGIMKTVDDPLQLENFFPTAKPLNFMGKISTLVPTPLYVQYEQQAQELNDITRRLKALIKALKVRGFYDSTITGIEKVLEAEDNTMIPVENRASMPDAMGMDKMLWLMPLKDIVSTVQALYVQREQCKQIIYEITGISDILRGSSVASETATAQNIKNQWGTLRLKKFQKEVQRYCRDSLRIMLEIAVTRFSVQTISGMTGLPFPTQGQKTAAQMQVQQQQQQAAIQAQFSGQPPQPPQVPPQVQQVLQSPAWEDVIALLKDDTQRNYRVDIQTNSTIDAEATQDKQDIADLLNAMSQFLNGMAPLVENGTMPMEVAKQVLLAIARRYTFGPQLEDAINQMTDQSQQQKGPSPEDQAKAQAAQAKSAADQAQAQADTQKAQLQMQVDKQEHEFKMEEIAAMAQLRREEIAAKQAEVMLQGQSLRQKTEFGAQQHSMKMAALAAKPKEKEPASGS